MPQPRIRMFAGPNGSGKSTIKEYLLPHHIGAYLNADELEYQLKHSAVLHLDHYHRALNAAAFNFLSRTKTTTAGKYMGAFIMSATGVNQCKLRTV